MITFRIDDALKDAIPSPDKAGKFLPQFYKKLPVNSGDHPENDGTAKKCVPFMEAITSGFVIPLWSDVYVTAKDGDLDIIFPHFFPIEERVESHEYEQLQDHPASSEPYGKNILKFMNPWIVETPPGVSCIFTTPMNHFETRFKMIDGIVDTDNYYSHINFPFIWNGGDGEFFIEKGTPLIQVIPFVRYDFGTPKIKTIDHKKKNKTHFLLGTALGYGYKKYFWHKRKK